MEGFDAYQSGGIFGRIEVIFKSALSFFSDDYKMDTSEKIGVLTGIGVDGLCLTGAGAAIRYTVTTGLIAYNGVKRVAPQLLQYQKPVPKKPRTIIETPAVQVGPNFIAGPKPNSIIIPTSRSVLEKGFQEAGFAMGPTRSPGMSYTMPNGRVVRVMEASGPAPVRASFNSGGQRGGPIDPFTIKPHHTPKGTPSELNKALIREYTHVILKP